MSRYINNYRVGGGWHTSETWLEFGEGSGMEPPLTEAQAVEEVEAAVVSLKTAKTPNQIAAKRLETADDMVFMRVSARSKEALVEALNFISNKHGIG